MTPAVVRLRVTLACLVLVALSFSQSPGLVVPDTKLDLAVAPLRFLGRALHLWDPDGAFGQLQNQAYGYLFPMGPFFALGELAALPGWAVQRLWLALVLCTALLGARRLARELGVGGESTQLLAGVAYALSPRVLTVGGPISIEAWPLAVLPWVLAPLVRGLRGGSERRAAMRSGVAVLCIGGVNAAATLAVLPLAGLLLLSRLGSARGRRLAAWWALAVPLATLWWVLPLLLLGRYSLPFLDYIETAATTTAPTALPEALRGTSHWLAYVSLGDGPWWRAGWELVTASPLILATALLAALGLAGLVRRDMPERTVLLGGVLLGAVLVTLGHVGSLPWWLTPPLAEPVRELLDGALAPFRNVHKFDAVLRLPLVLGLAHLAATVSARELPADWPAAVRRAGTRPVAVLAAVGLLVSASPLLAARLTPQGGFESLPTAWERTAEWLGESSAGGRALVVPGAPFAEYVWGRPLDEPLQPLAESPWAVRNAVPLGSEGNTRLLDAVEERLASGLGSAGLAPLLAQAGVTHVVVRHDLDWVDVGAPPPVVAERALRASPGLQHVASFGERTELLPPVDVFAVDTGVPAPVRTYAADRLVRLSGGPESLLAVADLDPDLLRDRPVVLAGEPGSDEVSASVVTDGMRRREVDFGRVRDGSSPTLTADEPLRLDRPAADLVVVPGVDHMTTATYEGARAIRASSSAGDAGSFGPAERPRQAWSAFDGDLASAWLPDVGRDGDPWVEVVLDEPREVRSVRLTPLLEGGASPVARVRVTTDAGSVEARVTRAPGQVVELPPGRTGAIRVTITDLGAGGVRAGLREVAVPGVEVTRVLAAPADAASAPAGPVSVALARTDDSRADCVAVVRGPLCAPGLRRVGEERGALERSFVTTSPATVELTGLAQPVPGPALDALLASVRGSALRVRASDSVLRSPIGGVASVLDGSTATTWTAPETEVSLELAWDEPRSVDGVQVRLRGRSADALPLSVSVSAELDGVQQPLFLPAGSGLVSGRVLAFPPVRADKLVVTLPERDEQLQVAEVRVPALTDLHAASRPDPQAPVALPCGRGPQVVLDGTAVPTAVATTYDDLLRLEPVRLVPCVPGGSLVLPAGEHRLTGKSTATLRVEGVLLSDRRMAAPGPQPRAVGQVETWEPTSRRLTVTAGPETLLAVQENANAGWRATLDGRPLEAVRLDGWQQGWRLPAGAAGEVRLDYAPDRTFRAGLLAGLAAALVLLLLALLPARWGWARPAAAVPRAAAVPALLGAAAVLLLGGVAGLLALAVGVLARSREVLPVVAGGALGLAGLVVALEPWPSASAGALSAPAQLLALTGLGAAAAALLPVRSAGEAAVHQP